MKTNPFAACVPIANARQVGGVLDWVYGVDEEIERSNELDARLKALNDALYEKGKITDETRNQMNARIDAGGSQSFSTEVYQGFYDGLTSGYRDMVDAVSSVADAGKDAIKSALDKPVSIFQSALETAARTVKVLQWLQWGAVIGGVYLVYRFVKSDAGKAVIMKRL